MVPRRFWTVLIALAAVLAALSASPAPTLAADRPCPMGGAMSHHHAPSRRPPAPCLACCQGCLAVPATTAATSAIGPARRGGPAAWFDRSPLPEGLTTSPALGPPRARS